MLLSQHLSLRNKQLFPLVSFRAIKNNRCSKWSSYRKRSVECRILENTFDAQRSVRRRQVTFYFRELRDMYARAAGNINYGAFRCGGCDLWYRCWVQYLTDWRKLVHRHVIRRIDKLWRVVVYILHVDRHRQMRRYLEHKRQSISHTW